MAVQYDILGAIKTAIQGLSLSGVSSANVVLLKVATDQQSDLPGVKFPAILLAPFGAETMDPAAGTNVRDDTVYPVLVGIVAADNRSQTASFETYLGWRESIRKKFHNNISAFSGVSSVFNSVVSPLAIVDAPAWLKNSFVSGLIVRVSSREART
jgi:hypothetical protein